VFSCRDFHVLITVISPLRLPATGINFVLKSGVKKLLEMLAQLVFPHTCVICGTNELISTNGICRACIWNLPATSFLTLENNEVEKIFWGRLPVTHAAAATYFTHKSAVQKALHQIKYGHRKDAGLQLGRWMGIQLMQSHWWKDIDWVLPMPIHASRRARRGYNQAELLCQGIGEQTGMVVRNELLERVKSGHSLTTQHRVQRWQAMREVFAVRDPAALENRHVLLVDDVVTTGATLEAMGEKILACRNTRLSIYCFAYTLPN
jgi:ComF family protein